MPAFPEGASAYHDVPAVQSTKPANVDRLAELKAEVMAMEASLAAAVEAPAAPVAYEPVAAPVVPAPTAPAPAVVPNPAPVPAPAPVAPVNPTPSAPVVVSSTEGTVPTSAPAPAAPSEPEVLLEDAVKAVDTVASFLKGKFAKLALFLALIGVGTFILIDQARPANAAECQMNHDWATVQAHIASSGLTYTELTTPQRLAILSKVDTQGDKIDHIYVVPVDGQGVILVFVSGECVTAAAPASEEAFEAALEGTGI